MQDTAAYAMTNKYFLQIESPTQQSREIDGEDGDLVLAAAHVEDAKSGR